MRSESTLQEILKILQIHRSYIWGLGLSWSPNSPDIAWTLAPAEVHRFPVSQACKGGGGLAPLYVWHKIPSPPMAVLSERVALPPSRRHAAGCEAAGILHLRAGVLGNWVKGYEEIQRRHQPSSPSSSFCRSDQIRVMKRVNLLGWTLLPAPPHLPKKQVTTLYLSTIPEKKQNCSLNPNWKFLLFVHTVKKKIKILCLSKYSIWPEIKLWHQILFSAFFMKTR